jgi:hypothetical protein
MVSRSLLALVFLVAAVVLAVGAIRRATSSALVIGSWVVIAASIATLVINEAVRSQGLL